jgi:hypothetical protein
MGSSTATVIAVTWAGVVYAWTSWRILVPLVLGIIGLIGFFVYEAKLAPHPMVRFRLVTANLPIDGSRQIPLDLLATRTSLSGYVQIFIWNIALIIIICAPSAPFTLIHEKSHCLCRLRADFLRIRQASEPNTFWRAGLVHRCHRGLICRSGRCACREDWQVPLANVGRLGSYRAGRWSRDHRWRGDPTRAIPVLPRLGGRRTRHAHQLERAADSRIV